MSSWKTLCWPSSCRQVWKWIREETESRAIPTRTKCARLGALAVVAAEQAARVKASSRQDGKEVEDDEYLDEIALTRMIVEGSQLCEQVETVIS